MRCGSACMDNIINILTYIMPLSVIVVESPGKILMYDIIALTLGV